MTPEEMAALKKQHEQLMSQVQSLLPVVQAHGELKTKVENLEKENLELKKGVASNSQESAILALKTKYPDVPEDALRNFPPEIREAQAKNLQDHFSKVKATVTKTDLSDPLSLWTRAGGIGPTDDATIAAEQAAQKAKLNEAKAKGNVMDMLSSRTEELVAHLRRGMLATKS